MSADIPQYRKTLTEAHRSLKGIVTMTVFVVDARFTTPITELRMEIFGNDFSATGSASTSFLRSAHLVISENPIRLLKFRMKGESGIIAPDA
jgi:2-iminobutanoate/2-iminopropanoate deaminase